MYAMMYCRKIVVMVVIIICFNSMFIVQTIILTTFSPVDGFVIVGEILYTYIHEKNACFRRSSIFGAHKFNYIYNNYIFIYTDNETIEGENIVC